MKDNRETITNVLSFLRDNFHRPLTVPQIAKAAGFSRNHLWRIVKSVTGESLKDHLTRLRMERATELLRETNLEISRVAEDCGFRDAAYFSTVFRKIQGSSPSAYRKSAGSTKQASPSSPSARAGGPVVFREQFEGTKISSDWRVEYGDWTQEDGSILGKYDGESRLQLERSLPENFRLSYEMQFVAAKGLGVSDAIIELRGADFERRLYEFHVGSFNNVTGEFRKDGNIRIWNPRAVIRTGRWQRLVLEMRDDTIELKLDGETMFLFREAFPQPFARRCRLQIGAWESAMRLRDLSLSDLGILPVVRAVRQGDSLFNEGLFERAAEFYLRYLRSGRSGASSAELDYKIGMCRLRLRDTAGARQWLGKASALPEDNYWARQARVAILETDFAEDADDRFERDARDFFAVPSMRDGVREVLRDRARSEHSCGFYDKSATLAGLLVELESATAESRGGFRLPADQATLYQLAESLEQNHRFSEIESLTRPMIEAKDTCLEIRMDALRRRSYARSMQGKFDASDRDLEKIRSLTDNVVMKARCETYHAINERGRGRMGKADKILEKLPGQYPMALALIRFGREMQLTNMYGVGRMKEADDLLVRLQRDPEYGILWDRLGISRTLYIPHYLRGEYGKASRILLENYHAATGERVKPALLGVMAGVLLELGGDRAGAAKLWKEIEDRFPETRCPFYGGLAGRLRRGEPDGLEEMPYPPLDWSELCFLVANLMKERGDAARARELLKLTVQADPTLRWPAWRAKNKS